MNHHSATAQLPTQPTFLTFFLLFWVGALRFVDPDLQFFFCMLSYLNLHLFLPRAQIKPLGPFDSLPIYKSAKIKLFE